MASQQPTPSSAPTKPSERLYETLSPEARDRVLTEFRRMQLEDRGEAEKGLSAKQLGNAGQGGIFTREHGPVTPPRTMETEFQK
jgi:hypothetical protein